MTDKALLAWITYLILLRIAISNYGEYSFITSKALMLGIFTPVIVGFGYLEYLLIKYTIEVINGDK